MKIEDALFAFVTARPEVAALIGDRFYPCAMPQRTDKTAPYPTSCTYQRTNATRERAASGPTGLVEATYLLTCWATGYDEAKATALALRDALDGNEGPWSGFPLGSVEADDTRDDFNSDLELFGAAVELTIQYREA